MQKKRADRILYKEVQQYEDAVDDVTVRKGWLGFKIGLATIMLCTSISLYNHVIQDIHDLAPQQPVAITLQEATEEQISLAKGEIQLAKDNSEYDFNNLTESEQLDAVLRISFTEEQTNINRFKNSIIKFEDQELLENIVQESFKDEYSSFSEAKKEDLLKLAYELLDEEKKDCIRDPELIKELAEKREAERIEREKNMAEVEARLNKYNQEEMELE